MSRPAFVAVAAGVLLAQIAPVFPWVASVAPSRVAGLPFALVWTTGGVLVVAVALAALHATEEE